MADLFDKLDAIAEATPVVAPVVEPLGAKPPAPAPALTGSSVFDKLDNIGNAAPVKDITGNVNTKSDSGYMAQEGIKGATALPMLLAGGSLAEGQQANEGGRAVASLLGWPAPPPPVPATPNATTDDLSQTVLGDKYDPATAGGRYGGAVARGVGAAATTLPLMPLAGTSLLAAGLGTGVIGPLVGQGASDTTKALGGGPRAQAVADITGNVVAGGLSTGGLSRLGTVSGFGALAPSAAEGVIPSAGLAAVKDAGIETNPGLTRGIELQDQFGQTPAGQYQKPAQAFADKFGPDTSPTAVGTRVMQKGQTWLDTQKANADAAYREFEAKVPPTTQASANETQSLLTTPTTGGPPPPPIYNQLTDAMNKNGNKMTYADLKEWRTRVGAQTEWDKVQNGGQFNNQLKALYDGLTKDMEATIQGKAGDAGVEAFRAVNKAYGETRDFIDTRIGKLADEGLTPEQVHTNLTANPAKTATRIQDLVNRGVLNQDDINMVARQQLNQMGKNAQGDWDAATFNKAVTNLQKNSPEAERALFRGSPEMSAAYDKQVALARYLDRGANSEMNAANKGSSGQIGELVKKAIKGAATVGVTSMVPGAEHAGEMAGAVLMGGESHAPQLGNVMYRLAQNPAIMRILVHTASSPSAAASYLQAQAKMSSGQNADDLRTLADAVRMQDQ